MNTFSVKTRVRMDAVVQKLGLKDLSAQDWLILTPKDKIPKPAVEMFPRPPKRADGSYIYDRIPPTAQAIKSVVLASGVPSDRYTGPQSQLFKKRAYEDKPPVTIDVPAKLQRTGMKLSNVIFMYSGKELFRFVVQLLSGFLIKTFS